MKKIQLTERQRDIILMLPSKNQDPITTYKIGEKLNLSDRTVKRDMAAVKEWFELNDFVLINKPGVGYFIDEDKEMIDLISELLKIENIEKSYQKQDRIRFILSRLLVNRQASKYYVFTNYLKISDKTLSQDLIDVEAWLRNFDIELIRRQGEGIYLKSEEKNLRQAQINLIYESLDDNKKIELIRDISENAKVDLIKDNDVFSMLDKSTVEKVKKSLKKLLIDLSLRLSDNAYIGLVVHISMAIERIKKEQKNYISSEYMEGLVETRDYIFAKKIVEELEREFDINIPQEELTYIAMHIKGANIIGDDDFDYNFDKIIELSALVRKIVNELEEKMSVDLSGDARLETDLKNHLGPALNRIQMDMKIRNPILDEVMESYLDLFGLLKEMLPKMIAEYSSDLRDKKIPDDEIGFLTIHFAAALERNYSNFEKVRIMTTCPTGIGTSRLLGSKLEKKFSEIQVVDNISIMNINNERMKENQIDLLVSTINLELIKKIEKELEIPVISVSTIPSDDDFAKIRKAIKTVSRKKIFEKINKVEVDKNIKEIDIEKTKEIYQRSVELNTFVDNIVYFDFSSSDDLISESSKKIVDRFTGKGINIDHKDIYEPLKARFDLEKPYFEEYKLYLLHARANIDKSILAFANSSDSDESIIVMLLGHNDKNDIKDIFSGISFLIVENDLLIEAIRKSEKDKVRKIVENFVYENLHRFINS